jgi:hypothetical protein
MSGVAPKDVDGFGSSELFEPLLLLGKLGGIYVLLKY